MVSTFPFPAQCTRDNAIQRQVCGLTKKMWAAKMWTDQKKDHEIFSSTG